MQSGIGRQDQGAIPVPPRWYDLRHWTGSRSQPKFVEERSVEEEFLLKLGEFEEENVPPEKKSTDLSRFSIVSSISSSTDFQSFGIFGTSVGIPLPRTVSGGSQFQ